MDSSKPFILSTLTGIILTILFTGCCVIAVIEGSMYVAVGGMLCIILVSRRLFSRGSVWMLTLMTLIAAIISAYLTWTGPGFEITFMSIVRNIVEENLFFALLVGFVGTTRFLRFVEEGAMWKYIVILLISAVISTLALTIMAIFEVVIGILCIIGFLGGPAVRGGSTSGSKAASKQMFFDKNGNSFENWYQAEHSNDSIKQKEQ